ncbi:phage tail tube protein [Mesorhizobium sp.]|uniref:phage tail tube protein n=1 Tax=Mesorhizobium sp. TaxID=1871066 RepID=UPI0011F9F92C|nr:phage tail tube protein [Mesorhizobium sp.]TIN83100.1 MAG: hypothetical protein E5X97_27595 [Mesorhizobium sp.]
MARATTANFDKMVVEVEWVANSGIYSKWCGVTSRGINRQSNMQTTEVPDCDDESLPAALERAVQSQEVTISGSGVWSAESHGLALDWWYSGATKSVRVHHVNAASGDTEYETGPAYLVTISNQAQRGQKVTADLSIEFDGVPTRTDAA